MKKPAQLDLLSESPVSEIIETTDPAEAESQARAQGKRIISIVPPWNNRGKWKLTVTTAPAAIQSVAREMPNYDKD